MFNHPIVQLYFYLSVSLILVLSDSIYSLLPFVFLLLILSLLNNKIILKVLKNFIPTIFFFPLMLIFYITISLLLTEMNFYDSLEGAFLAFLKFSIIVLLMNFYIESSSSEKLIISFRSLWVKTKLKWKWVDNFFLFLSLAMRLYPTFQSNWINNANSQKAIGIRFNKSYYGRLFDISKALPAMLVYQLNRSSDIALAMKLRGYGLSCPRSVIHPIDFNFLNLAQIIFITFFSSYLIGSI